MLSNFRVTISAFFYAKSGFPPVFHPCKIRLLGRLYSGTRVLVPALRRTARGLTPYLFVGGRRKQRSTLSCLQAGCLGAKLGKKTANFTRTAPCRRQSTHWLLACRRACLRSRFHSLASPTPSPFRPHWDRYAQPMEPPPLAPDGASGCAAPACGLAGAQPGHRSWVLPLGPATRPKTSPLPGSCWRPGGRPDGRRHAG